MKKRTLAAIAAASIMSGGSAQAQVPAPAPPLPDPCVNAAHDARAITKSGWSRKRWRTGPDAAQLERLQAATSCLSGRALKKQRRFKREVRVEFKTYRAYRKLATLPGLHEGDPYLEWLVVPAWVVAAETRGYHGRGRWAAQNSSGACGPYQLLGHTSCSVTSSQDKLRHHRVAAGLPRGSWAVGYSLTCGPVGELLAEPAVHWWDAAAPC